MVWPWACNGVSAFSVVVDCGLVDQRQLEIGLDERCLAMCTNSAAQPSVIGEYGKVCEMMLWAKALTGMVTSPSNAKNLRCLNSCCSFPAAMT